MYSNKLLATARSNCPVELLGWFANQTLSVEEQLAVERHLRNCERCRQDVAEWTTLRDAVHTTSESMPLPRADLFGQLEIQLDAGRFRILRRYLQRIFTGSTIVFELLAAQFRLIRRDLLWLPLLILPLAVFLARSAIYIQEQASLLAFVASFITALCMAFLYGQDADPARELTLVTRTSPRLVLCMRCSVVFGYDLLINLAGVLPFLPAHGIITPAWFLANWLAPLCCLAAISLLLSVLVHPAVAVVFCSFLWILRAMSSLFVIQNMSFLQQYEQFWHSGAPLFGIAALAVCLTFLCLERRERFSL